MRSRCGFQIFFLVLGEFVVSFKAKWFLSFILYSTCTYLKEGYKLTQQYEVQTFLGITFVLIARQFYVLFVLRIKDINNFFKSAAKM